MPIKGSPKTDGITAEDAVTNVRTACHCPNTGAHSQNVDRKTLSLKD
ncbi:hypothetical protein SAMN04488004_11482 [Loktanella salsilacus]|uniref:Uncharacterized protein n=1 Tax=Loktanella salsilacus TaxID=195913 RepID=A0A1I4GU94_9RHOB|nr:hypothetical protein SAMN04488004_11482 [Loktanella salsilacus]